VSLPAFWKATGTETTSWFWRCHAEGSRWHTKSRRRWARSLTSFWFASSACQATRNWLWGRSRLAASSSSTTTSSEAWGFAPRRSSELPSKRAVSSSGGARLPGGTTPLDVAGKVVILVDDGLATGSSMLAAVNALRKLRPAQIVVAVPAAPESTCRELSAVVDDVVCATTPSPFFAVGESYWDFTQVTDDEVRQLLRESRPARPAPGPRESRPEVATVRSELAPMPGAKQNQDMLIDLVGDAHFVLLGEASHGTHEF
jgi:phosphoribosyl transferase-like protein